MTRRFRGEFEQTIDAKGRVSIPARFIRVVEAGDPDWSEGKRPTLIIVYGGLVNNYIEGYTVEAMAKIDEMIDALPEGSDEREMAETYFYGNSLEAEILEDGRIVLPIKLRNRLDLTNKAYFIAAGDHFRIWNPEVYAEREATKMETYLAQKGEGFRIKSLFAKQGGAQSDE